MILTKLESHHLDLPIWRYKIHKIAFKSANLNYPTTKLSLTRGTRVSAGPAGQWDGNRGDGMRRCGGGLARRRRGFRRHRGHLRDLRDETRRLVLLARPKAHRRWLVAGEGGTTEFQREAPTMASPQCPFRAQYELHGVTTELTK